MRQLLFQQSLGTNLCPSIAGTRPWFNAEAIASTMVDLCINHDLAFKEDITRNLASVNVIQSVPTAQQWETAHRGDKETNFNIQRLKDPSKWQKIESLSVSRAYRPFLRDGRIKPLKGRLIALTPLASSNEFLSLTIVPESLSQLIFQAYHCSGVGGHMRSYKTLLILRLRFFWPKMKTNIFACVQQCSGCIPANGTRRENTGLVLSWPLASPFAIISVNLWSPDRTTTSSGYKYLMNAMCDMTQFVISIPTKNTTAAYLVRLFMEHVFLKFGSCAVVVFDDGSTFRGLFD